MVGRALDGSTLVERCRVFGGGGVAKAGWSEVDL